MNDVDVQKARLNSFLMGMIYGLVVQIESQRRTVSLDEVREIMTRNHCTEQQFDATIAEMVRVGRLFGQSEGTDCS